MIINLINYIDNSLIISTDRLNIENIDFISKKITISQNKLINSFSVYDTELDVSDSPKLSVLINYE